MVNRDFNVAFNAKNSIDVKSSLSYNGAAISKHSGRRNDDDEDDDTKMVHMNLARSGNHIYFYDEINTISQMWLQTQMTSAYEEYVISNAKELAHSHSITENIYLHINSPGGSVVSALAIYDFIKNFPMIVVGVVEGMAASGASIMLCACAMRQMTKTSTVLCHELRHVGFGYIHETWHNIQDQYENDKFFMSRMKDIYLAETKIPASTIDEALSHDLFWGVDKCTEYELCDFTVGAKMTDETANIIDKRVESRIKDNEELDDCEVCTEASDAEKADEKPKAKKSKKTKKTEIPKETSVEEKKAEEVPVQPEQSKGD